MTNLILEAADAKAVADANYAKAAYTYAAAYAA